MADQPLSPPAGSIASLPHAEVPPAAIMRLFSTYEREQLASFVEVAIGLLDLADPDPDEPDFAPRTDGLPGDSGDHEPGGDEEAGAYIEWHTKRPAEYRAAAELGPDGGSSGFGHHEDDEDDDPAEDDDSDRCGAGDDMIASGPVFFMSEHGAHIEHKYAHHEIGDATDAEDNGDVELNGDEGGHSGHYDY